MPFQAIPEEKLQELETKFGRVLVVRGMTPKPAPWSKTVAEPPWEAAFRPPTMGESDAFEGAAGDAKAKSSALRTLARNTCVAVSFKGVVVASSGEARDKGVQKAWDDLRAGGFAAVHIASQEQIMELMGGAAEDAGKG